jgi:hypothetical protein
MSVDIMQQPHPHIQNSALTVLATANAYFPVTPNKFADPVKAFKKKLGSESCQAKRRLVLKPAQSKTKR